MVAVVKGSALKQCNLEYGTGIHLIAASAIWNPRLECRREMEEIQFGMDQLFSGYQVQQEVTSCWSCHTPYCLGEKAGDILHIWTAPKKVTMQNKISPLLQFVNITSANLFLIVTHHC